MHRAGCRGQAAGLAAAQRGRHAAHGDAAQAGQGRRCKRAAGGAYTGPRVLSDVLPGNGVQGCALQNFQNFQRQFPLP